MVETVRIELTTPCLQGRCSSQLSYVPILFIESTLALYRNNHYIIEIAVPIMVQVTNCIYAFMYLVYYTSTSNKSIESTVLASNQCSTLARVCPSQLDEPWIKLFTNQTMSNSIHVLSVTLDAHLG